MGNWKIGEEYNDAGEFNDSGHPNPEDQFTSWLRVDKKQGWGIANASGIRTLAAGYNDKKIKTTQYSCVVLVYTLSSQTSPLRRSICFLLRWKTPTSHTL